MTRAAAPTGLRHVCFPAEGTRLIPLGGKRPIMR